MRRIITQLFFGLFTLCLAGNAYAQTQNSMMEVIPFKTVDGKIIIEATVNGEIANFVLDLAGHNAILPNSVKNLHIKTDETSTFSTYNNFQFKDILVGEVYKIESLTVGSNTFSNDLPCFVLKDEPYLRKLGVDGVLNSSLFRNSVLTIDMQRKKLTITQPYRPSYMKLNYRDTFNLITGFGIICPVLVQDKTSHLVLDTWSEGFINLTEEDFKTWSALYPQSSTLQKASIGYQEMQKKQETLVLPQCTFIKTNIEDETAIKNPSMKRSSLGKKILDYGIISIDYLHQKIYFQPFDLVSISGNEAKVTEVKIEDGKLNPINRLYFLNNIFDFRKEVDFVYKGAKPIVIDFWASWCGPCMRLLPQMEKMAEKYKGKVIFYKVNADKEKDLCNHFNIQGLPTLFFVPAGEKPIIETGATPEKYIQIIEEQLLK